MSIKPKVEYGVPPPARKERAPRASYEFGNMKPGATMFPLTKTGAASFRNYGFRHGWQIATQQEKPDQYRIWRIA